MSQVHEGHDAADCLRETIVPGHACGGFRELEDRLKHDDDVIDPDALWQTAQVQLPTLATAAAEALSGLPDGNGPNEAEPNIGKRRT